MSERSNRNLQTSRAPLKSQAQGTSLFLSATSNQRGCPELVSHVLVHGRFISGCQWVRGGRVAAKADVV